MSIISSLSQWPFVSVDPGRHTAMVYWTKDGLLPTTFGYKETINDYAPYLLLMAGFFRQCVLAMKDKPKSMVIEGTGLWGSLVSQTSAVRGDSFGLAMLVGTYVATAQFMGMNVTIVSPQQWKGQLSKQATAKRVEMILHKRFSSEHITDAIGIGLWAQGRFTVKGVL